MIEKKLCCVGEINNNKFSRLSDGAQKKVDKGLPSMLTAADNLYLVKLVFNCGITSALLLFS